jgi:hypothetical protein
MTTGKFLICYNIKKIKKVISKTSESFELKLCNGASGMNSFHNYSPFWLKPPLGEFVIVHYNAELIDLHNVEGFSRINIEN